MMRIECLSLSQILPWQFQIFNETQRNETNLNDAILFSNIIHIFPYGRNPHLISHNRYACTSKLVQTL